MNAAVTLTSSEKRWAQSIASVFRPVASKRVDVEEAFVQVLSALPWMARMGTRFALLMVALSPMWRRGRARFIESLGDAARAKLLGELLAHRWFAVRELTMLLKVVACMANFRDAGIAKASGYFRGTLIESGVRSLSIVDEAVVAEPSSARSA